MFTRLKSLFLRHRYKLAMLGLLIGASAICVMLVASRMLYADSRRYTNLLWNLFLAWIPFAAAFAAYTLSLSRRLVYVAVPVFALLWLVFFPNAPYLLTDLQHLADGPSAAPLWYDVILMVWFSWTGLLLGLFSLYLMHEIVRQTFGRLAGWIFVLAVSGLSSAGIYVGRFLRWNSWDLLQNPSDVALDILGWVVDPSLRLVVFIGLFTAFFLFAYLTLYAFGHILRDDNAHQNVV